MQEQNGTFTALDLDTSLCEEYDERKRVPLGLTPQFMKDTCGSLGKATLSMAVLAPISGTLMFVALLLGITCCKKNSIFVRAGAIFAIFGGIFTVIAVALWAQQSRDLHDNVPGTQFNVSFAFAIVAAVLFFTTNGTACSHIAKGDLADQAQTQTQTPMQA